MNQKQHHEDSELPRTPNTSIIRIPTLHGYLALIVAGAMMLAFMIDHGHEFQVGACVVWVIASCERLGWPLKRYVYLGE